MTTDKPSALQLWILDQAYDFPEPIWQLIQPTTWVIRDAGPHETATMHHDPPKRATVKAALVDLLEQGLLEIVHDDGNEPVRPVPPPDWHRQLDDAATWQPRSPLCVFTTTAGGRFIETAFTTPSSPERAAY